MFYAEIILTNGQTFRVRRYGPNNTQEFIKQHFMPHGVQSLWYGLGDDQYIQISNIVSIKEITEEEIEIEMAEE